MSNTIPKLLLEQLEEEAAPTRKCLERFNEADYDWKPHAKSMQMGYLAMIVAEIPLWIHMMVTEKIIDYGAMTHTKARTGAELAQHFDDNMAMVRKTLEAATDDSLQGQFELRKDGQSLMKAPMVRNLFETLAHSAHHRGQLTVYMRLKDIPVPSVYGPSADDRTF